MMMFDPLCYCHYSSVMVELRCCDTASFVRYVFESQYASKLLGIK